MYNNGFSVEIKEGFENQTPEGCYVALNHGQQFGITVKNDRDTICHVEVLIQGKSQGLWKLPSFVSHTLERPAYDNSYFTFYKTDSKEGKCIGLSKSDPNVGLLTVIFTPKKSEDYYIEGITRGRSLKSISSGGVGLSGKSSQSWLEGTVIPEHQLDYSNQTTFHIRLVERNSKNNNPKAVRSIHSSKIPPTIQ